MIHVPLALFRITTNTNESEENHTVTEHDGAQMYGDGSQGARLSWKN